MQPARFSFKYFSAKFSDIIYQYIIEQLFSIIYLKYQKKKLFLIITNSLNEKMGKVGVLLGLACGAFVLLGILLFLNKKQLGQTEKGKGRKLENKKSN